ncbi:hypothetical protein [Brachybacterium huguangmaarense]
MDDVAGWIGAAIGALALVATIPVLVLTVKQHRRDTERSVVEWIAHEREHGVIVLRNQGLDSAHEVTAEVWDAHDTVTETEDEFGRNEARELVLARGRKCGPDPVGLTRIPRPPVSDQPPPIGLVANEDPPDPDEPWVVEHRRKWAEAKALHDIAEQQYAERRKALEAEQVAVRVTWRSELGRWHTELLGLS